MKRTLLAILLLALIAISSNAGLKYPYQDANKPVEQRVEDLLSHDR